MKKLLFQIALVCCAFASVQTHANSNETDVRATPEFIETCPDKYLAYYDKSEGGNGFYCECPDEKMSYMDKVEGGPGLYCQE